MFQRRRGASVRSVHDERVAPPGHDLAPDGLRATMRALRPLVGGRAIAVAGIGPSLERFAMASDPPSIATCITLESGTRPVETLGAPQISAFLDGIQRSRIIGHVDGSPIIFATVAAVVRQRVERKLETWRTPRIRHLVLAAREHVGADTWAALEASGVNPVDVTASSPVPLHPLAVRARALDLVGQERETLERRLAAEWCADEQRWLWIDGGISGNLAIHDTAFAFGVVKSHSTLYGEPEALRATLELAVGKRGPLFLVQHRSRRAIASWYLRVHTSDDGDPLHGLIRVEVAPPATLGTIEPSSATPVDIEGMRALTARADAISEWILAERAPLAMPDPRWDTLTYGVYACEQFLKALIGS